MYLFTRTGTANPHKILEATAWATEIASKVTSITSVEVQTWSVVFGAPINTIVWTAVVDSPAVMASTSDKLLADSSYLDALADAAELWDGVPEDGMIEMITTVGEHKGNPTYASIVRAQCATGRIADAMAWGADMANHVYSVTGRDGMFGHSLYGPWAEVGWFSMADTAEEIDAATAALAADPTYLERVDQAGELFVPTSGEQRLSRRIG